MTERRTAHCRRAVKPVHRCERERPRAGRYRPQFAPMQDPAGRPSPAGSLVNMPPCRWLGPAICGDIDAILRLM